MNVIPAIAALYLMLIFMPADRFSLGGLPDPSAADSVVAGSAPTAVDSIFGASGKLGALWVLPDLFEAFPPREPIRYRTGRWPTTGLAARDPRYLPPAGFIRVTRQNEAEPVSERFLLRDFLTHDQRNVWPKVLVLQPVLVDKLELIGSAGYEYATPAEPALRELSHNGYGRRYSGREAAVDFRSVRTGGEWAFALA